jgi:hypothetical protein
VERSEDTHVGALDGTTMGVLLGALGGTATGDRWDRARLLAGTCHRGLGGHRTWRASGGHDRGTQGFLGRGHLRPLDWNLGILGLRGLDCLLVDGLEMQRLDWH